MIYCVVPAELDAAIHDQLRELFRGDADTEVVVEFRRGERRRRGDRRAQMGAAVPERRRIRNPAGRRVDPRRAPALGVDAPRLPPALEQYADRLEFLERVEPPSQRLEDVDTARLVIAIQAGANERFAVLYNRYYARVYTYMRLVVGDPAHAEIATQEVFAKVADALPRSEPLHDRFRVWLFTLARKVAIKQLARGHGPDVMRVSRAEKISGEQTPAPPVLDWISDRQLQELIDGLPMSQRQVLFLRHGVGLSPRQIAAVLERMPDTILRQDARALAFLRRRIGAEIHP